MMDITFETGSTKMMVSGLDCGAHYCVVNTLYPVDEHTEKELKPNASSLGAMVAC